MYQYISGNTKAQSMVIEQKEDKDIATLLEQGSEHIALLKVNTDVMQDAGIDQGDVVAVDRHLQAGDNSIVVALIDSDMVIRKLEAAGGKEILVTPGRKLAPLDVTGRLIVWGVVTYVIRRVGVKC